MGKQQQQNHKEDVSNIFNNKDKCLKNFKSELKGEETASPGPSIKMFNQGLRNYKTKTGMKFI